ncbi:MAG: hypothetical protein AAGD92_06100 [Pseudomonadota bacterium]
MRCFVIGPIGADDSPERKHSNQLFEYLLQPIVSEAGYSIERADKIGVPGMISQQIIERLIDSELVIADLSFHNANAFYELAIRHQIISMPTIHVIREGEKIPFDVSDHRAINFDLKDLEKCDRFKRELRKQLEHVESSSMGEYQNPLSTALAVRELRSGNSASTVNFANIFEDVREIKRILKPFQVVADSAEEQQKKEQLRREEKIYREEKKLNNGLIEYNEYYDHGDFVKRFSILMDGKGNTFRRDTKTCKTLEEARRYDPFQELPNGA